MTIISHAMNGDYAAAHSTIPTDDLSTPWDHATAHCLRAFVDIASGRQDPYVLPSLLITVRHTVNRLDPKRATTQTRLGLCAVDLASELDPVRANFLYAEVAKAAAKSCDAFAAREVLKHPHQEALNHAQRTPLQALVEQAALGRAAIEPDLRADLTASLETAARVLRDTLAGGHRRPG